MFRRPDGRHFVRSPLEDVPGVDLYASVDAADSARLRSFEDAAFTVHRRENVYRLPTTTVGAVELPEGVDLLTADQADENRLRELDDLLRQDVPGTDGWKWEPDDFHHETYDSPHFDPELYLVACAADAYVGIARVWLRPDGPRLGFIGVVRSQRRRGLAKALLGRAFGVLVDRGVLEVRTEIDTTNIASRGLLEGLGAEKIGETLELVRYGSS